MRSRLLLAGSLLLMMGVPAGAANAEEGDPPSGPEACVAEAVNEQRTAAGLEWSGTIQDELRRHASSMADRGELDHAAMSDRVAGLPAGWSGYGETSYAGPLDSIDPASVESWCRKALEAFWTSSSHRQVLEESVYDFMSVGTHWDGQDIWVVVGVFAHSSYEPAAVSWPRSYAHGLTGGWDGHFYDDDGSVFEQDVERLTDSGLTRGCNPPVGSRFCPGSTLTRGEMAAFLARAFGWDGAGRDRFVDDDGSVFEQEIEALASRGVTEGCNPPESDRFCPGRPVSRGEMATFLGRALGLDMVSAERFSDISASVHSGYIDAVAEAGITTGCDSTGTRYCPNLPLTRGQMAAFLVRAGLAG